jgi:DNA-binding GntR family transcriptional regulator
LQGDFPPGQPIKERDQAAVMKVSRTPMREAVRILSQEGLVILRAARSPIVADPSFEEISQVIDVLTTLETRCGVLACTDASDEEIEEIVALDAKMQSSVGEIDSLDLFEIDMEFHMAIARASHNSVLAETHRSFVQRLWRARYLSTLNDGAITNSQNLHAQISKALKARDVDAIHAKISEHLADLTSNIRRFYTAEANVD